MMSTVKNTNGGVRLRSGPCLKIDSASSEKLRFCESYADRDHGGKARRLRHGVIDARKIK